MLFLNIFYVLIAIAMIGLILMQRGAGAQAGSGFGGGASGTVFGSRGSSNFLTKSTKWLAAAFFVIAMVMAWQATQHHKPTAAESSSLMTQVPTAPAVPSGGASVPTLPVAPAPSAPVLQIPAGTTSAAPAVVQPAAPSALSPSAVVAPSTAAPAPAKPASKGG